MTTVKNTDGETTVHVIVVGRGVYALPLLRILGMTPNANRKQLYITLATSVGWQDQGASCRGVDSVVIVPRPDCNLDGFTKALCDVVRSSKPACHRMVMIPVAEETLFLAQPSVKQALVSAASQRQLQMVFRMAESCDILLQLHHKFQFPTLLSEQILMMHGIGQQKEVESKEQNKEEMPPRLEIPRTSLVHSTSELAQAIQNLFNEQPAAAHVVIKPVMGHGSLGSHILSRTDWEADKDDAHELLWKKLYPIEFVDQDETTTTTTNTQHRRLLLRPYVVQEFMEGRELSTYSWCHKGTVLAHVCYAPRQLGTHGFSSIRSLASPAQWNHSLIWIQQLVSKLDFTGHLGVDWMERFANGALCPLECNPRATNGLGFFAPRFSTGMAAKLRDMMVHGGGDDVCSRIHGVLNPAQHADIVVPRHIMTLLPTLSCIAKATTKSQALQLCELAVASHDDIWWGQDPLPGVITVMRIFYSIIYATAVRNLWQLGLGRSSSSSTTAPRVAELVRSYVVDEVVCFDLPSATANAAADSGHTTRQPSAISTAGGPELSEVKTIQEDNHQENIKVKEGLRVLVTGATGFLGGRIVQILYQQCYDGGDTTIPLPATAQTVSAITATGRNQRNGQALLDSLLQTSKKLPSNNSKPTVQFVRADLSIAQQVHRLVRGHDIVIHCAALCVPWDRWEAYMDANVTATQIVAHACAQCKVQLLVHISSPSICAGFDSGNCVNIQETDPLPAEDRQANRYSATKMLAEVAVMDVSQRYRLPCIILRPRAIFGPGDTTLLPLLLKRLRRGKMARLTNGTSSQPALGDYTYVDNVVHGCLCCFNQLPRAPATAKIYNITNGDPQPFLLIVDKICDVLQLPRPRNRVPRWIAYQIAAVLEAVATVALLAGFVAEPLFTRYSINAISLSCTYDISAAKKELGYNPVVSFDEGLRRFLESMAPSSNGCAVDYCTNT